MVHPTPIYETLASLLIFWVLWRRRRRIRAAAALRRLPSPRWAGRFLVEFVRINEPVAAGLTLPQLFAAASIFLGTVLLLAGPRARAAGPPRWSPATR